MTPRNSLVGLLGYIRENYLYDKEGFLSLRRPLKNGAKGRLLGKLNSDGYLHLSIKNKHYKYHRVIYLYFHGTVPDYVDHVNRIKSDNRIENLRESTAPLNSANSTKLKGFSKFKGVSFHTGAKKWISHISKNGKLLHLGYFEREEDAAKEYDKKASELFGGHAVLNF